MAYTTIDNPFKHFNTVLYTGNGSTQSITGVGYQPDWVWLKKRNASDSHYLQDAVRGATKAIKSNSTDAEATDTDSVTSFNSDGFSLGNSGGYNSNTNTFVAWNWKAGTSFSNDASSTGIGSVDSTGSINTDAGFSIIKVVKNNTTAHTVAHGLGAVPQMIIGKSTTGGSYRWIVYHQAIGNTHALYLNEDFAKTDSATFWNDTTPTSSVFSLGTDNSWNGTNIFYCFAEKQGYSKFGSYTGNGNADGTFVYTGFKPAFILIKNTTTADQAWFIFDNKRDVAGNENNNYLIASSNAAERGETGNGLDMLSNGFKLRSTGGFINDTGTFIYAAFAEAPFVTAGTKAAGTAR